jgi:hypothetical protein
MRYVTFLEVINTESLVKNPVFTSPVMTAEMQILLEKVLHTG